MASGLKRPGGTTDGREIRGGNIRSMRQPRCVDCTRHRWGAAVAHVATETAVVDATSAEANETQLSERPYEMDRRTRSS
jgi:hypothetical protein